MAFSWLTFSTAVYYRPGQTVLGGSVSPDYIVDFGLSNIKRLMRTFPGCTLVLYYNRSCPQVFLQRLSSVKKGNVVLVFCDEPDLRAPMLGRVEELNLRRSEWTITFDIHDDIRHQSKALNYIRSLPRQHVEYPIRYAEWKINECKDEYVERMRTHGDVFPDAAGFMVHKSAPRDTPIAPRIAMGQHYQYGDDEIVLKLWLSDKKGLTHHAPAFCETNIDLSGVEILDKSPCEKPRDFADEVWTFE